MNELLRMLLVEDSEADAALLVRTLSEGGFDLDYVRVETEQEMRDQLQARDWDIVISDYTLPRFDALRALRTMHELEIDLPVIIVSGTIDEDTAVAAIRAGAHDFMAKGQFARLIPAIERELRDADVRAEREKMRQQLRISDRMASIGTLAAGVAHEINNPLTAVVGGLELATEDIALCARDARQLANPALDVSVPELASGLLSHLKQVEGFLVEALEAAERVRLIVRDLKGFSRDDDDSSGPVDVEQAIAASIRMVRNEVRHRARLSTHFSQVPPVAGNEARLGQVFLNLIINAAQAMRQDKVKDNEIVVTTRLAADGRVCVEVRDNGPGIPEAIRERIFDPFFTTKAVGKGTGLGLAICHRIIEELEGELQLESQPGRGTTFRTLLPVFVGSDEEELAAESVASRPGARVLIIDDEAAIGRIAQRMLRGEHEVTVVTDPREALRRIGVGDNFDVVLCDLMMPDVSGIQLYREITRLRPKLVERIAFMSGGTFTKEAREFLDQSDCPHLEKPFHRAGLRKVIHSLYR